MKENIDLFTGLLEKKYGTWNRNKALFGTTPYGKVASDLSISSSQFSKLLYGTATEGMYERTLNNINRLIERQSIEKAYEQTQLIINNSKKTHRKKIYFFSLLFLLIGLITSYFFDFNHSVYKELDYEKHPLENYFYPESSMFFDSPYTSNSAISENCPCSGFEGKWILSESFKLPLPGMKKPGLYYLAKSADLMIRCSNLFDSYIDKGHAMMGYEHLKSEIWIDTQQEPLVPQYFNPSTKEFTESFKQLSFESDPRFKKIADLAAFNVNMFEVYGDSIARKAELSGRLAVDVNKKLAEKYKIDVGNIIKNVLGDLIKASCKTAFNPYCNPNDLTEGKSIISFDCVYTISEENLGLEKGYPYTKSYLLKDQVFSDYLPCECEGNLNNE
ncbi:hypothetical protein V8G56_08765 [Gaetbulibacter aquiaggeris]|uniref:Uncharacterized protein n=1 Tax=Gaetbulibacter aquiaggeris TaxID=1735373 RepID=A0ABW7MQF4_9FLAO